MDYELGTIQMPNLISFKIKYLILYSAKFMSGCDAAGERLAVLGFKL